MEKEIKELRRGECFLEMDGDGVEEGTNMLSWLFVLTLKNMGTSARLHEPKFAAQGHIVIEKLFIGHEREDLKHSSVRIILNFSSVSEHRLWMQHVTQAYIQSDEPLRPPIFPTLSKILGLPKNVLWKGLN